MHVVSHDSAVGQAATDAPRHAIFSNAHKGLRRCLADTLVLVGRTDAGDPAAVAGALAAVGAMLEACRLHLVAENRFIHPAMEARRPGSSRAAAHDHDSHERAFEQLASQVAAVEGAGSHARQAALSVLYHQLALFAADNYEHMYEEETANQVVLWDTYTDQELRAIEAAIIASHSPAQSLDALRWMLPAMTGPERVVLLTSARTAMPPVAFEGLLQFVSTLLEEQDSLALRTALGLEGSAAAMSAA